jgi:hypothetical protein
MDISGRITPIYDTVDGYLGSRLYSSLFNLNAGDTLTMDLAWMPTEGKLTNKMILRAPRRYASSC